MSKFKPGDRVVPVKSDLLKYQEKYLGTVITITKIEKGLRETLYHWSNPENLGFWESDLVTEEYYNSPLVKALR